MKNIKSYLLVVMVCMVCFGICVPLNIYAIINCNGAGQGYDGTGRGLTNENSIIAGYIIDGAGFYLAAQSEVNRFLKLIELKDIQGLEYNVLNEILGNAITDMKKAVDVYEKLIIEAESIPYNIDIQNKLRSFDYYTFITVYRLNPYIFEEVGNLLRKGDITGVLKKNYKSFVNILELLQAISGQTSLNKLPELSIFWKLNETISESSIFGSYVARVFLAIN